MSTFSFAKTLSADELKTRELFNAVEWTPMFAVVAQVFVSHSCLALTIDDVARMCSSPVHETSLPALQKALTALARKKVLRSRKQNGQTLYEVNY